jgi:phage-related minor tail protein
MAATGIDATIVGIIAFLSSLVSSLTTIAVKKERSPESKNELARIGNEFAEQLLNEARSEREQLRATISELESVLATNHDTMTTLRRIAVEKDLVIQELEARRFNVALKLRNGQKVTYEDVFGTKVPIAFIKENPEIMK